MKDDLEVGGENEMGVFRRTLTAQSAHRARQDERLRLKSIQIVIFLENNQSFHLIRPFFLGWDL